MPRILLLHASIGMGHQRAALALAQALRQSPGVSVEVEDTLDHARSFFRRVYAGAYLGIADRVPAFWSLYYASTNQPRSHSQPGLYERFRLLSTSVGVPGLPALLDRVRPDAIVCTHFLPIEALAPLRRFGLPPVYLVLTDYHAHQFWALDGVDRYFVPTAAARDQLAALGVPRPAITVAGIPVDPALSQPADRLAARRRLGLEPWQPVVTLVGSGMPAERVRAIAAALLERRLPATLLIATGRNHDLAASLGDLERTASSALRVLGPQPSLDPLFVASDLVIGKAGGLTVSEVLARGVPLIIPTPVPGQERWNAEHVVGAGAGLQGASARGIARMVADLLDDDDRRAAMSRAALAAGRPAAAQTIAAEVLADIQRPHAPKPRTIPLVAARRGL
ncbi:MAG: galactosyldiacylglycerol synthase [Kouleothrix sp.]|nr:galactosyldiacylglycerol synthase [Kouleothrix sp.]